MGKAGGETGLAHILVDAKRATAFAKRWGLRRLSVCVLCKLGYRLLRAVYGFDPWHASAPYACREYKRQAVLLASSAAPRTVVDIGCGLGEVVARVPANRRYGFDPAAPVVKAARLLFGSRVTFGVATISDVETIRRAVREESADLVIMTGWTHGIESEKLHAAIVALNDVLPVRLILIDAIHEGTMGPRAQRHDADSLKRWGEVVRSVDAGDGVRDLHLFRPNFLNN